MDDQLTHDEQAWRAKVRRVDAALHQVVEQQEVRTARRKQNRSPKPSPALPASLLPLAPTPSPQQ
jgi:hypothetical protein